MPSHGAISSPSPRALAATFAATAAARMIATIQIRRHCRGCPGSRIGEDRLKPMLLPRSGQAEDGESGDRRHKSGKDRERRHAVKPHERGGGIADHAAGAARIGGGDDRGEETHAHPALDRHGAPSRPPRIAAAILSRNADMTKTMPRRARPPVQLSGSRFGR